MSAGNRPPKITRIALQPDSARAGDRLRAAVESVDPDGDPVRYRFTWWRNEQPVGEGIEPELDTAGFVRGDRVTVEATPRDQGGPGKPRRAGPVTLANSLPAITSTPPAEIKEGRYRYSVTAIDPDGDTLTYRLDRAPPGMTIDQATGRIEWQMTQETKGAVEVRVSVEDGQSGRAFQEFVLSPLAAPSP